MALTTTTISAAVAVNQNFIVVASATGFAAGNYVLIDQEVMLVANSYVSGTTVPVIRGQEGTLTAAHNASAKCKTYLGSDSTGPTNQTATTYPTPRGRRIVSLSATATLTLPLPGEDMMVFLNGTSVIALTIPVPTTDMDGCELSISSNGAAAHTLTFTGGLSAAGSSYDVITVNATAPAAFKFVASFGAWQAYCQPPMGGTVTNIIGSIA